MAQKRKLRLEIQQSNENGQHGVPKVPQWYGEHAAITTEDITGSVMKILITDSNGEQIAISVSENGSIYEMKRNTEIKERYGITIDPSDPKNGINEENTNVDDIISFSRKSVQQSINSLENGLADSIKPTCKLNLESVNEELEKYDDINTIEPSVSFRRVADVISEGYSGSETLIEPLEVVDEFYKQIEKIKTEETNIVGQFETVYIDSVIIPENCEISKPVPEQRTEPSTSVIESEKISSKSLLCRLCAIQRKDMIHLFEPSKVYKNLIEKIQDCLSVLVREADILPQRVCQLCLEKLELFHKFRETVAEVEKQFVNSIKIPEELGKSVEKNSQTHLQCDEQPDAESPVEVLVDDAKIPNTNETSSLNPIMENNEFEVATELKIVDKDNTHCLQSEIVEEAGADEDIIFLGKEIKMKKVTEANLNFGIIKCRICGLLFSSPKSCYRHSRIHTSANYYPCAMCDSIHDEKDDSYLHSLLHTSDKQPTGMAAMYTRKRKPNYNLRSYVNKRRHLLLNSTQNITTEPNPDGNNIPCSKDNITNRSSADQTDNSIKCRICGMHFEDAESCFLHSLLHVSANHHPCSMCDKIFTNEDDNRRHSREHIVPTNQQRRAELFVKKVSDINQQCSLIMSNDKLSNNAEVIVEKNGTDNHNILCGQEQIMNHISGGQNDVGDMLNCRICGMHFETAENCYLHSINHVSGNQRPCSMCDQIFTNEADSLTHSQEHIVHKSPIKKMKLCIKKVSDINLQASPIIGTNRVSNTTENMAKNDETDDVNVEGAGQNHTSDDQTHNIDMVKCRICGKYFGTPKNCYLHSFVHVSGNQFPCSMCDSVFTNINDSRSHSHKHIFPKTPVKRKGMCVEKLCNGKPRFTPIMSNNGISNTTKDMAASMARQNHISDDHNDNIDMVKCRICGRYFGSPKNCYLHSFVHISRNQYPCSMCDKILTNRYDSRRHSHVHIFPRTPVKRTEICVKKLCNKKLRSTPITNSDKFSNITDNLAKDNETDNDKLEKSIKNNITDKHNDNVKTVSCRICGLYFGTAQSCYAHSFAHVSGNQYPCSMCDRIFTNEDDSRTHSHEHIKPRELQSSVELRSDKISDTILRSSLTMSTNGFSTSTKNTAEKKESKNDDILSREERVKTRISDNQNDSKDMVKCRICGRYFGTAKSCYLHSVVHVSGNQYPCSMCDKVLTSEDDSRRHRYDHIVFKNPQRRTEQYFKEVSNINQRSSPTMSSDSFSNNTENARKDETDDIKILCSEDAGNPTAGDEDDDTDMVKCRICGSYFGTARSCFVHSMIHVSGNQRPCSMCDKSFTSEVDSYRHSYEHIVFRRRQSRSELLSTKGCIVRSRKFRFSSGNQYLGHLRKKDESDRILANHILLDIEEEGGAKNLTPDDKSEKNDMIACRICGITSENALESYSHSAIHVQKDHFPCTMCDKNFPTELEAFKHNIKHTMIELKARETAVRPDDESEKNDMIACRICGVMSPNALESYSHSAIHVEKDHFPCTMCDKNFPTESEAFKHNIKHTMIELKTRKTAVDANICRICGTRYESEMRLRFHKIYHDSRKIPCYCEECDKAMISENYLYNHMRNIHNWPNNMEYTCMKCGKQFKTQSELNGHKLSHALVVQRDSCINRLWKNI